MLYSQGSSVNIFEWDMLPTGVRIKGSYSLDDIERVLSNAECGLPTIGIPVSFARDQIQSGGLFSKQYENCLVLKNQQHTTDYFHFVFTARTTGNVTTIGIYRTGSSPRSYQSNKQEERRASSSLFQNFLGAVTATDQRGLEEEYDYYAMVADVIKECFGI